MKSNVISLVSAGAMTGATTINSSAIPLEQIYGYAIQAVWTGTPNGTIKLQASCDVPAQTPTTAGVPTNWTDIADTSTSIAGTSGNQLWNVNGCFYRYVRLTYTNTSSTGSLSALMSVKGV